MKRKKLLLCIKTLKKTDLQTIKTNIAQFGFDADDLKADPIAYEKLDRCCKK